MTSINHAPAVSPGFPRAPLCTLWFKVFDGSSRSSTDPGRPPNKLLKFFLLTSQMFLENYGCAA
jgi:hypothetical protein